MSDGGPAFPFPEHDIQPDTGNQVIRFHHGGMSLRDYFAAKAMQGWLATYAGVANHPGENPKYSAGLAESSYAIADAMIAERNKPTKET